MGSGERVVQLRLLGAPATPPSLIHEATVGDHENPGSETGFGTFESADTSGDVQVDLTGEVLGIRHSTDSEKGNEWSREIADQQLPGPFSALLCRRQHAVESLV